MEKNEFKIGQYLIKDTVGTGAFGKVKLAVDELTGMKVAVKIMDREKIKLLEVANKVRREISNLKQFEHPHIIRLYHVMITPTDIFMIMEYVSGGELFDYIINHDSISEGMARRFFQQITSGVYYCHLNMIVHRDLKPENLLLDSNLNIKIGDFGLSNIMRDGEFLKTSCGSPNYAAPEIISGKLYAGPEVDVWSCGVILFALLSGHLPFDAPDIPALFRKIKHGVFKVPDKIPPSAAALILKMLQVDPVKRIHLKDVIKNDWFRKDLALYLFPERADFIPSVLNVNAVKDIADLLRAKLTTTGGGGGLGEGIENWENRKTVLTAGGDSSSGDGLSRIVDRWEPSGRFDSEEEELTDTLLAGDPTNPLVIAYHLLVSNNQPPSFSDTNIISPNNNHSQQPAHQSSNYYVNANHQHRSSSPYHQPTPPWSSVHSNNTAASRPNLTFPRPNRRAKWHLGIRSESKPEDIMMEVYRAMVKLDYEWHQIDSYHLLVRQKDAATHQTTKQRNPMIMSLQLYFVEQRQYLLDFKHLHADDEVVGEQLSSVADGIGGVVTSKCSTSTSSGSISSPFLPPIPTTSSFSSASATNFVSIKPSPSQIVQFFEMAGLLISALTK